MDKATVEKNTVLTLEHCDQADFGSGVSASSFTNAALRGDMMAGPATFLTRMKAGAVAPWHWHTHTEELLIVKGTIVAHLEGHAPAKVGTGGYSQLPAKHIHRFRCTADEDCLIFVVDEGAFDIHWVDNKGAEISETEAMQRLAEEGTSEW